MDILTSLLALGVLELTENDTSLGYPPFSKPGTTSLEQLAPVMSEDHRRIHTSRTSAPKNGRPSAPSLLWKAYANALLPFLSLNSDLSTVNQALFIASPLQYGVPANNVVPEPVTNYQQYIKADCMQTRNVPIYSLENGSYFEQLWMQV